MFLGETEEEIMDKPIARTLIEWFESLPLLDKLFLRDAWLEKEQEKFDQQMKLKLCGQELYKNEQLS